MKLLQDKEDDARFDLFAEGAISMSGYNRGIAPAFRSWWQTLRYVHEQMEDLDMLDDCPDWWDKPLGHLDQRRSRVLTRRVIAGYISCPRGQWSLTM